MSETTSSMVEMCFSFVYVFIENVNQQGTSRLLLFCFKLIFVCVYLLGYCSLLNTLLEVC